MQGGTDYRGPMLPPRGVAGLMAVAVAATGCAGDLTRNPVTAGRAGPGRILGRVVLPIALATVPLLILGIFALRGDFAFYFAWIEAERGPIETGTVVVSLIGMVVALLNFRHRRGCPHAWMGAWMALFAVGFLYLAGEEASWGQHIVGWETPGSFAEVNRQAETNLHNLSKSLDSIPKVVLGIGIVLSGVLWPLFRRAPAHETSGWFAWLWPTRAVVVTALCFLVIWIIDRGLTATDLDDVRGGEIDLTELRELLSAYFLLVYVWAIGVRLRGGQA